MSYCVVILRTTPHWPVRMTSCNFRLLTWEQQIKITFAAWACGNRLNIFDKYISEIGHCAVLFVYIPVLTGFDHVRFL